MKKELRKKLSISMKAYRKTPEGQAHQRKAAKLGGKRTAKLYDYLGANNPNWNGGSVPSYGYNKYQQYNLALNRAGHASELSGIARKLQVHHKIHVKDISLKFLEICYPSLYRLCGKTFGMFEQSIRLGHKNYKHYKGIPTESIFPHSLYDAMNSLDNLVVLTRSEHSKYEDMPPTFFDAVMSNEFDCFYSEASCYEAKSKSTDCLSVSPSGVDSPPPHCSCKKGDWVSRILRLVSLSPIMDVNYEL